MGKHILEGGNNECKGLEAGMIWEGWRTRKKVPVGVGKLACAYQVSQGEVPSNS